MSRPFDPTISDSNELEETPLENSEEKEVDYVKRGQKFAGLSSIVALLSVASLFVGELELLNRYEESISLLFFLFPFSFSFSYLAFESIKEAERNEEYSPFVRIIASIPIVMLVFIIGLAFFVVSKDSTGWGAFGLMVGLFMMIPPVIVALILAVVISRILEKQDNRQYVQVLQRPRTPFESSIRRILNAVAVISFTGLVLLQFLPMVV